MEPSTSGVERSLDMVILGLGIGLVMQVLVLAVQNDVDYRDLGVATSGATFFRSIGGCFGVAICGAIFSNRLADELSKLPGLPPSVGEGRVTREMVAQLPPAARAAFVGAYSDALTTIFAVCAPIAALAFLLSWLLPEKPLRRTVEATGVGEAFAAPKHHDPLPEIERALSTLARRDSRVRILERLCPRAGVELNARQCWVLARVGETRADGRLRDGRGPSVDPARVAARIGRAARARLHRRPRRGRRRSPRRAATRWSACVAARRERLAELLDGWSPEREADLAALLTRMARDDRRRPSRRRSAGRRARRRPA